MECTIYTNFVYYGKNGMPLALTFIWVGVVMGQYLHHNRLFENEIGIKEFGKQLLGKKKGLKEQEEILEKQKKILEELS